MMATPKRKAPFRARTAYAGGDDFARVKAWADAHLTTLVRDVHPTWGRGRGGHLRGPCFLHGGTNPNLDIRDGRGWMCHSACNGGGDGVDLWRRLFFGGADEKAGRLAALRDLAPRAGVVLDRPRRDAWPTRAVAPAIVAPPAPATPADPLAAELAALRADGLVPADAPKVYAAVLAALPRTEAGDAVLHARGFDPERAHADGFRHIGDATAWRALRDALAASFLPVECMAAGFRPADDAARAPTFRLSPWGASVPALVIPYRCAGDVVALRFRATTPTVPKGGRYRTLTGQDVAHPFNADALADVAGHVVHIVEGELNAYALAQHGRRAVGLPGAASWRDAWTPRLRDARAVVVWFDQDDAGARGKVRVAESLVATFGAAWVRARCHDRPLPPARDANDLHRAGVLPAYLETVPA